MRQKLGQDMATYICLMILPLFILLYPVSTAPMSKPGCKSIDFPTATYMGPALQLPVPLNTRLELHCNDEYYEQLTYSACAGYDEWEDVHPRCMLVECPAKPSIKHGYVKVNAALGVGALAQAHCDEDYWYDGPDVWTCLRSGTWSQQWAQCKDKNLVKCQTPELDEGIEIYPNMEFYGYGYNITVTCSEGYKYEGGEILFCQTDNKWLGNIGKCKRIECQHSSLLYNGRLTTDCNICQYGTRANITCYQGFEYNGTSFVCGEQGTWIGHGQCIKLNEKSQDERIHVWSVLVPIITSMSIIGIVIIYRICRTRTRSNSAKDLRQTILKDGHKTEQNLDKRIDLDTEFVHLRLIQSVERSFDDGATAAEYQHDLEHSGGKDIAMKDILLLKSWQKRLVLMQGRAGVGKTTLVHKLAYLWAKNEKEYSYDVLLLFNMRLVTLKGHWNLTELMQKFNSYCLSRSDLRMVQNGIANDGDRWLVIMDAIDEFPDFIKNLKEVEKLDVQSESSPLKWCVNIWRKDILTKSTVLLTSR